MTSEEIVLRMMGAHWDIKACDCWVCREGHKLGLACYEEWLNDANDNRTRLPVPQFEQQRGIPMTDFEHVPFEDVGKRIVMSPEKWESIQGDLTAAKESLTIERAEHRAAIEAVERLKAERAKLRDETPIDDEFAAKVSSDFVLLTFESDYYPYMWHVTVYRELRPMENPPSRVVTAWVTTRGQVRCLLLAAGIECEV